jgi:DNA ligase (NAD+)
MDNINLSEVYENLLKGKLSCGEASAIMQSPQVKSLINAYINKGKINSLIPYFDEDLQNIYMIINITQFIYNYSGLDTGISDSTYDTLYSIMIANGGNDVISVPITPTDTNIVEHKYPKLRGTLTKTYYLTEDEERTNPSRKYLDEWKRTMEAKIYENSGKNVDLDYEEVYIFPKFDGVSGIFEFGKFNKLERVLTRGFTETNEAKNITHIFPHITRAFQEFGNVPYGLKTEIMMSEENLEYFNDKYGTDYKNSRSIVSAIINSDDYDKDKADLLKIIPLRVGDEEGNQELVSEYVNFPYVRCLLKDREVIRKFANEHRYVSHGKDNTRLRCDGAVIYIINPELQKILGRENHKNNFEVAYKFTEEVCFSEVKDIVFNIGLFGRLAPVARVKAVKLKGNTIENISLGSIGRMRKLGLRKGDRVKVLYDIIPYLSFDDECEHNMKNDIIDIPDTCPDCGEKLEFSESCDIACCVNPKCSCRIKGKILNYLNKMNIDGLSYGVIDKLYDYDIVNSIQDIYKIDKNKSKIVDIDGFGGKMVKAWVDEIDAHREVRDYVVLGSLGIEGMSKKTFEKVLTVYTIDELVDICENNSLSKLVIVPGIQDKSAKKIVEGLNSNIKLIKFLEKELVILPTKGNDSNYKFSVCFTKVRDKDMENYITEMGGQVSDSLTKDTTFLVVPYDGIESSKVTKAKSYDIPVISIDNLKNTIDIFISQN